LGCFARDDDGVVGLISNNHVIALEDRGTAGDEILHPSPADHGVTPQNVIARLRSPYPRIRGGTKIVDCAFGEIVDGVAWDPSLRSGKRLRASPGPVTKKLSVFKYGRTTHATEGRVLAFEVDKVVVDYAGGFSVRFDDQIEIEPDSGVFADRGDSGALVHDEDRYAVGLLFAVIENRALAYANPMQSVLTALQVRLVT
jgi:hypothetical protein